MWCFTWRTITPGCSWCFSFQLWCSGTIFQGCSEATLVWVVKAMMRMRERFVTQKWEINTICWHFEYRKMWNFIRKWLGELFNVCTQFLGFVAKGTAWRAKSLSSLCSWTCHRSAEWPWFKATLSFHIYSAFPCLGLYPTVYLNVHYSLMCCFPVCLDNIA